MEFVFNRSFKTTLTKKDDILVLLNRRQTDPLEKSYIVL